VRGDKLHTALRWRAAKNHITLLSGDRVNGAPVRLQDMGSHPEDGSAAGGVP
jgi:hypothetical protein